MIDIAVANRQHSLEVDASLFEQACSAIVCQAGWQAASISVAVVDDREMHRLNRTHLNHDYPTDVLSFVLSEEKDPLEGEVIVSADTAQRNALRLRTDPLQELLLYVVHGTLHLVGLDDKSPAGAQAMRQAEAAWLEQLGLSVDEVTSLVYPDRSSPR